MFRSRVFACSGPLAGFCIGLLMTSGAWASRGQDSAPAQPPPAQPPQEPRKDLPPAKDIVERYVKAIGGREAIMKHSSRVLKATMTSPMMPGEMQLEMIGAKPNKLVQKVSTPQGEMLAGFDGKVAWASNAMMGATILEGEQAESLKRQADFFDDLKDLSKYQSVETVDLTEFEGRKCYKLRFVLKGDTDEKPTIEYFDAESGLQVAQVQVQSGFGGETEVTMLLQDYKEFGGVKSPTKMIIRAMGMEQTLTISSIEYDKVEASAFDLPAEIQALLKEKESGGATKPAESKPQP